MTVPFDLAGKGDVTSSLNNSLSDDIKGADLTLPSWTSLPATQFTDNVLGILGDMDLTQVSSCDYVYDLSITTPDTIPQVKCQPTTPNDRIWCLTLNRIFTSRPIPYNVSIGFVQSDKLESNNTRGCIGSSSPGGKLVLPNMEDIREMIRMESSRVTEPDQYRWAYRIDVPFEERHATPVFRGTAWATMYGRPSFCLKQVETSRYKAVLFSTDNPTLLDARFSGIDRYAKPCFQENAMHAFTKLLPVDRISTNDYFSKYQVALVLGGIGAAFRLSRHFMTSTAVILQDLGYQEWFTKYLQPFVHYIPLAEDLLDLNETLHWVQVHPAEVKSIGKNGRAFWEKYLTFAHNEDHIYELVYRLAEYTKYVMANQTTH
ncbi:glucosyltransferase [Fragilaria crotonensis]|nr:glucosyltransferase [Fragilaria crotonensis]